MRNKLVIGFLSLLVLLSFVACDMSGGKDDLSTPKYGSITVYTNGLFQTRSILPPSSAIEVHHYNISGFLTTDDSKTFDDNFTGSSYTKKLIAGTWSFVVSGYNSTGQIICKSGTQTVRVVQNKNVQKQVVVPYLTTGEGTFSITMRIPSDQNVANVHIKLTPVSSHLEQTDTNYDIPLDKTKVDGTKYIYEDSRKISTGDYDALITMLDKDGDKVGLPLIESLHIHKDITSAFVWAWDDAYFDSVPNPVFATEPGTYFEGQTVTITTSDPDSAIYYTVDGSDPRSSETKTKYTGPVTLNKNTTVMACCVKGKLISEVITGAFNIKVATPVLSDAAGTYTESKKVTITCTTTNAFIYYTIDGTDPEKNGTLYEKDSEILISNNTTLKVVAKKANLTNSEVVSAAYVIDAQDLGLSIIAPTTHYGYELVVPEGWATGTAVVNGVKATLYANKTLKGVYCWYIDGEEIRYKDGTKPNYDLLLGTGDANYELTPGAHIITLKVKVDGTSYSCSYPLIVSGNGIGTAGNNTTHGVADYKVGDIGPSGGYIYTVKSDYSSGYRYMELSSNTMSKSVLSKRTYSEGLEYCNKLNINGYTDWSVPTTKLIKTFLTNDLYTFFRETDSYTYTGVSAFDGYSYRRAYYCQNGDSYPVYYEYYYGYNSFGESDNSAGIQTMKYTSSRCSGGLLIPVRYF